MWCKCRLWRCLHQSDRVVYCEYTALQDSTSGPPDSSVHMRCRHANWMAEYGMVGNTAMCTLFKRHTLAHATSASCPINAAIYCRDWCVASVARPHSSTTTASLQVTHAGWSHPCASVQNYTTGSGSTCWRLSSMQSIASAMPQPQPPYLRKQ